MSPQSKTKARPKVNPNLKSKPAELVCQRKGCSNTYTYYGSGRLSDFCEECRRKEHNEYKKHKGHRAPSGEIIRKNHVGWHPPEYLTLMLVYQAAHTCTEKARRDRATEMVRETGLKTTKERVQLVARHLTCDTCTFEALCPKCAGDVITDGIEDSPLYYRRSRVG